MEKIFYHASRHKIEEWDECPDDGTHFGSRLSAFRRADLAFPPSTVRDFYLHKVKLHYTNAADCYDVGSDWGFEIDFFKEEGYDAISYPNMYEESKYNSILVWDRSLIKTISIEKFSSTDLDDLIAEELSKENHYYNMDISLVEEHV